MDMTDDVTARVTTAVVEATDPDVVAAVHMRRGRELWTLGRRLGLTPDEADDTVQEALTRLLRELGRGTRIHDPDAWTFRIVYRLAMDEHRLRRRIGGLTERLRQRAPDSGPDVTARMAVWAEVGHLPERQRAVLYLRYRSDFTFDQIAAVLGISAGAARNYASTGVARIRDSLARAEGEDR
jgi:RNA polymerase sigma factor (sigma-70 family)